MLSGLLNLARRVRKPGPAVGQTPADVMYTENKWRLLRYRPGPGGPTYKTPLLMVPSLINRHYVLDLMAGKSFVEWLVGRGHDVWIIDWGTPTAEDRYLDFDTIVDTYIGRAIRRVGAASPRGKPHVLGYCLGGTLAAIHAAAHPDRMAGLIALAAPVQFGDGGLLEKWTNTPGFDLDALVKASGNVPWPLMQAAFHMLRPTLNLSKAVHVLDRAWDDQFLDGFFALEKWANDNVSFPGAAYVRYLRALYQDNELARGTLHLSGRPAALTQIVCPTLAVTFLHDNIVPLESAKALITHASSVDKTELRLSGGHVGAVVSKSAAGRLWPAVSNWLAARDTDAPSIAAVVSVPVPAPATSAPPAPAVEVLVAPAPEVHAAAPEVHAAVAEVHAAAPEGDTPSAPATEFNAPSAAARRRKRPERKRQ